MAQSNLALSTSSSARYFDNQDPKREPPPVAGVSKRDDGWQQVYVDPGPPSSVPTPAPELAETLSLPPGLHGQAPARDVVPSCPHEARLFHTHLSRGLGRLYRERWGIILRADRAGIESMQRLLGARFPSKKIRTFDDARFVIEHGALLTEVFARTCGAEWIDLRARELGEWRMVVPGGFAFAPFDHVVDFVTRRPGEDLVALFDTVRGRSAQNEVGALVR